VPARSVGRVSRGGLRLSVSRVQEGGGHRQGMALMALLTVNVTGAVLAPCDSTAAPGLLIQHLSACRSDRFGSGCAWRLSESLQYLPPSISLSREPSFQMAQACAAQAFNQWLCGLPPAPSNLEGITVGKTLLRQLTETFRLTLTAASSPSRPTFDPRRLAAWKWLPDLNAACPAPEDWLLSDSCSRSPWPRDTSLDNRNGLVASVRALVQHSVPSSEFWKAYSYASIWWAGQGFLHSLRSAGPCTVRMVESFIQERQVLAKQRHGPDTASLTIGMHIRRGDSCMRWAKGLRDASLGHGRPCYNTSLYMQQARMMMQKYGVRRIFLATDSDTAEREVVAEAKGDFTVTSLAFDRRSVGGSSVANMGKKVDRGTIYIEDRLKAADPSLRKDVVLASLVAELHELSQCDMLIGTSASWVSRLALFGMVGVHGAVPPFSFLDRPFHCLGLKPCPIQQHRRRLQLQRVGDN